MVKKKYDFAGYVTRYNVPCTDKRVIGNHAFDDCDGKTVPLVYQHNHDDIKQVVGKILLHSVDDGVLGFGEFNHTDSGESARECVKSGSLNSLSICANQLNQVGNEVRHGAIKEVSLVLAGANPGAYITEIQHSDDDPNYNEITAFMGDELTHTDGITVEFDDDEVPDGVINHADSEGDSSDKTVKDVYDTFNEDQKRAVAIMIAEAVKGATEGSKSGSDEEEKEMKHNAFADNDQTMQQTELSHSDLMTLEASAIGDVKKYGSLKDSIIAHADQDYGIKDIDILFPDARTITSTPEFIKRETDWVSKVMNGTHHTPFSRIKSVFADITADEARARGYMKGKLKKEEVFTLLKRTTDPQTIYKKQKLDRDDILDITDFDVLAWIKGEMRIMLDEELARAIVYGDGRLADSEDKIDPTHIRPIVADAELYTIAKTVTGADAAEIAKTLVDDNVLAMDDYRGSGNPVGLIRQDVYTRLLLLKDSVGYRLFKTPAELATAMMLRELIPVPNDIAGDNYLVTVNLNDYNVGADKGGAVSMFDDFDLDYNQQKYLIETRCSGALIKPYSAIVFKKGTATSGS